MLPRIVGFVVPPLRENVDSFADEAITALLDIEPSARWTELFLIQCGALASQLSLAEVRIEGSEILFYGSVCNARELADAVAAMVATLNERLMQEGNLAAGSTGASKAGR